MLKTKKNSYTGYRILLIFQMLLRGSFSKREILAKIKANPNLNDVSKDSIALDISTLKQAGFLIESPHKGNNYRYSLNFSPLRLKLSMEEFIVLNKMKYMALELTNWRSIVKLYEIFSKFSRLIDCDREVLLNFDYFMNIDFKLLKELDILTKRKKEVVLNYNSPKSAVKQITIRLESIEYSGSRLHLLGVSKEYPNYLTLRVDNILSIEKILTDSRDAVEPALLTCKFRVVKSAFDIFNLQYNERIVEITEEFVEIEGKILNEFLFVQRLVGLGFACVYIENSRIKEKVVKVLKNTLELYR